MSSITLSANTEYIVAFFGSTVRCKSSRPSSSPLKNALLAFFNLAKLAAKLLTARKITI